MRVEDIRASEALKGQIRNLKRSVEEEIRIQHSLQELQGIISPLLRIAGRGWNFIAFLVFYEVCIICCLQLSYHDNRCYAILFVFLLFRFVIFWGTIVTRWDISYIISRSFWTQWSFYMLLLLCCSMFSEYTYIYMLWLFCVIYILYFQRSVFAFVFW